MGIDRTKVLNYWVLLLTSQCWHFNGIHFAQGYEETEFLIMNAELEQRTTSYYLKFWKNYPLHVHVRHENISCNFSNVFEETQIQFFVLDPCQLQVAVNVAAIGISFSKVPIMMVSIRWHWHSTICTDANWNFKKYIYISVKRLLWRCRYESR